MSCKIYKFRGKEYNEKQLLELLSNDKDLVRSLRPQEQRGQDADYAPEDIDVFRDKVRALQETLNVEVVYDDTIDSSRLLGKNDPRTLAAGKPVIVINPNKIFKTTAIHEFSHVFIDSFPRGLKNPRIQKALKELEGTQLEKDVREEYSDLSEDMIQKEILATAIGREGSEIYDNQTKANSFEKFKTWLFDFIKRTFGIEKSEVTELSKELLDNKVKEIDMSAMEEIAQQERVLYVKSDPRHPDYEASQDPALQKTAEQEEAETIERKMERTYENLVGVLRKVLDNQKQAVKSSKESSMKESKKRRENKGKRVTRLQAIEHLNKQVDKTSEEANLAHKKYAMFKYLNWSRKELDKMYNKLDAATSDENTDSEYIRNAYNWYESFSILEDIQALTEAMNADGALSQKELDIIKKVTKDMTGKRSQVQKKLLGKARAQYAELLADHDTETQGQYEAAFRQSWKELSAAGRTDMQEIEYVMSKVKEHSAEIRKAKIEKAEKSAIEAQSTLSDVGFQILSEKDMSSVDIGVVSTITDKANHDAKQFITTVADDAYNKHKAFTTSGAEDVNSRNLKKKYKGMYTFDSDGQGYFAGQYDPQFMIDRREFSSVAADVDQALEVHKDTGVSFKKNENGSHSFTYSSNVKNADGSVGGQRDLFIRGSKTVVVDGFETMNEGDRPAHVTYTNKEGNSYTITLEEAIARSEIAHWTSINTTSKSKTSLTGDTYMVEVPVDKYENKAYLDMKKNDPVRFAELERLKSDLRKADKDTKGKESLFRYHDQNKGVEFVRMPGIMKDTVSRMFEGQSAKQLAANSISRLFEVQADDYETQNKDFTDYRGGETLGVPVKNRSRLKESDQSLDLHTMVLLEQSAARQYKERRAVESSIIVISEVMKEKEYLVLGKDGKPRTDAQTKLDRYIKGGDGQKEYQKVRSILENKVYGITAKDSYTWNVKVGKKELKISSQQIVKNGLKYFGATALVFNYANSIVNTTSGTISNFMEAVGGDVFGVKDYAIASKAYMFDLKNIMGDFGKTIATSKTNLTMQYFNSMGDDVMQGSFAEKNRLEVLGDMSTLRPLAKSGEHMMQGKATLAILQSIKALNSKGQYITKTGKVVKTKKEAASMLDMISFKNNQGKTELILNHHMQNSTFTQGGGQAQILFEARNLIRSKIDEMHGQYTTDIQAHAQRFVLGKMGFFLRKWMIKLTLRRWRGVKNSLKAANNADAEMFYDRDQKSNTEGYYVSALRFISQIAKDVKQDGLKMALGKTQDGSSWSRLSSKQKAGVRKTVVDVAMMTIVIQALKALGDDDDDDRVLAKYLLRRQQSELTFFINPMEAMKLAMTPTAAMGNLKNISRLLWQLTTDPSGRYKSGWKKDQLKAIYMIKKLFPKIKTLEELKDASKFLNSFGM